MLEHAAKTGAALAYQDPLIVEINDKPNAGRKEHAEAEAEAADKDYQQCLADVRREAQAFHQRPAGLPRARRRPPRAGRFPAVPVRPEQLAGRARA